MASSSALPASWQISRQAAPAVHQEEDLPFLGGQGHAVLHALGVGHGLHRHVQVGEDLGQRLALVEAAHALHEQVLQVHLQGHGGGAAAARGPRR